MAASSSFWPNVILGLMVVLTIFFIVIGYLVRKRYKHLDSMINKELGEKEEVLME
jgi:predicted anti-sigma-YlaC factor YlaD